MHTSARRKFSVEDTSASEPLDLELGANKVSLENLDLSYADTSTRLTLVAKIGTLSAEPETIDINRLVFDFYRFEYFQYGFLRGACHFS
jgi:hypothetical protein